MLPHSRSTQLYLPGIVPYQQAWRWQQQLVAERRTAAVPDALLLLEHPPVYTLGQGATAAHLRFSAPALAASAPALYRVERGGEVTYHCPGQLVGYPILNLRHYRQDLHWYLRQLEAVLIRAIAQYGLPAERIEGLTGVWVAGYKVAAIGIKVSRWITMHGFALNICPDMAGFRQIVPCGIADRPVGSLHQFLPQLTFSQMQQTVMQAFEAIFETRLQPTELPLSWQTSSQQPC
ncbi:MAG: lipoyl(octanoyl) transferase LipB [Leptolyngbya sp. SIO4C1]|nr:lipoyl(octanoyl) transferase LipB [Leptolyngbya sp. SIO4C1]